MGNTEIHYGPLFADQIFQSPVIVQETDLGVGSQGLISAADLSPAERAQLIADAANPKYHYLPTNRFRCIDGRTVLGGLSTLPGYADPQLVAGIVISEMAGEMFLVPRQTKPLSVLVPELTHKARHNGLIPVLHGDDKKHEEGCAGNAEVRTATAMPAAHHDAVVETVWTVGSFLGVDRYLSRRHITRLIVNGARNAENDALWDTTAEERVHIAVANGAEYERVVDDHAEKVIIVDTSGTAFDEEAYADDHPLPGRANAQAFVSSLGVYARWRFECARRQDGNRYENMHNAALGILAVTLFNVAVPKVLTANEQGNGEALPVIILGRPPVQGMG